MQITLHVYISLYILLFLIKIFVFFIIFNNTIYIIDYKICVF